MLIVYLISVLVCFIVALVLYVFATEKEEAKVIVALIMIGLIPVFNSAIVLAILLVGLVEFVHSTVVRAIEKRVGKND